MKIVALEEHFAIPEVLKAWQQLPAQFQDLNQPAASEGTWDGGLTTWAMSAW
jgi:hypothetical protein